MYVTRAVVMTTHMMLDYSSTTSGTGDGAALTVHSKRATYLRPATVVARTAA